MPVTTRYGVSSMSRPIFDNSTWSFIHEVDTCGTQHWHLFSQMSSLLSLTIQQHHVRCPLLRHSRKDILSQVQYAKMTRHLQQNGHGKEQGIEDTCHINTFRDSHNESNEFKPDQTRLQMWQESDASHNMQTVREEVLRCISRA